MRPTKRLLAFIGGIDLTSGRYDYPSHPLFDSCQHGGSHADDMHQACVEGGLVVAKEEGTQPRMEGGLVGIVEASS